jgi:hypothetical protein
MKALYRLYSAYPLLLGWKRRGGGSAPAPLTADTTLFKADTTVLTADATEN